MPQTTEAVINKYFRSDKFSSVLKAAVWQQRNQLANLAAIYFLSRLHIKHETSNWSAQLAAVSHCKNVVSLYEEERHSNV